MRYALFALPVLLASCHRHAPTDWSEFDVLADPPPPPALVADPYAKAPVQYGAEDYTTLLRAGERFFREGAYGTERTVSDVMGVMGATLQAPCDPPTPDCTVDLPALEVFVAAMDALDGTEGNLFTGNDGPDGPGYTSDLVLEFPAGTTLYGLPVPERVHSGLEVERGAFLPIGLHPVKVEGDDADLPWLLDPSATGFEGAPEGKYRLRLSCAACHYSLDIDNDGAADIATTRWDATDPDSEYLPHHTWGVGNHDLHFGWLFALSANPAFGTVILGGDFTADEGDKVERALAFGEWVAQTWPRDSEAVTREVVRGMLMQPRFFADVTSDARYNTIQTPVLYTRGAWPSNSNGAIFAASDRNNTVWTGALDFSGLIGLCADRGSANPVPWESVPVFTKLDCDTMLHLMLDRSPAVQADPANFDVYAQDILGESDGVPGLIGPEGVVVIEGLAPLLPTRLYDDDLNDGRRRTPKDYGEQGRRRGNTLALLGYRLGFDPGDERMAMAPQFEASYGIPRDEFVTVAVSALLDWMDPPPNRTPLMQANKGLVRRGYEVFQEEGCASCHAGPFFTDNLVHPLSEDPARQYGSPRTPSTAGWRVPDRDLGPGIETQPERSWSARSVRRIASGAHDPRTGEAIAGRPGTLGAASALLRVHSSGYRTTPLKHLWASAPYLHDGGVGVALAPGRPQGTDLAALLASVGDEHAVLHGVGHILAAYEADPDTASRPNPALSLQALVLESERAKVVEANDTPAFPTPPLPQLRTDQPAAVSARQLGIDGRGHPFYVDDEPGGPRVTALVAFLLALDDCPGDAAGATCPQPGHLYGEAP